MGLRQAKPKYTMIRARNKTLNNVSLTAKDSTPEPKDGKLEWVDDEGKILPNDTVVEAKKTYK